MTDKLTLDNARTVTPHPDTGLKWVREMTESDLVEVIESLGGEVVTWDEIGTRWWSEDIPSSRRYAILPLENE